MSFGCVNLTIYAMFDSSDAVVKESRPKVVNSNDFLGCGHFREMAPTSVSVTITKNLSFLIMGEAVMKGSVHSPLI